MLRLGIVQAVLRMRLDLCARSISGFVYSTIHVIGLTE